ncbi:MAG: hypothetical protein M3Q14_01830 [bacterium]|nr:hypothetical protein [bacterium]
MSTAGPEHPQLPHYLYYDLINTGSHLLALLYSYKEGGRMLSAEAQQNISGLLKQIISEALDDLTPSAPELFVAEDLQQQ